MFKDIIRHFSKGEIFVLVLLMLILIMNHSNGMITMLAFWCLFFVLVIPVEYYKGRLFVGVIIFTLLYGAFGMMTGFLTLPKLVGLCLPMPLFYVLGKFIVTRIRKPIHLILILTLFLICYQLEVYTSFIYNLINNGYVLSSSREFYLGGDVNRRLTATLVGLNVSVSMVGLSAFIVIKGHIKTRLLLLFLFVLAISITVYLINRTGLVIAMLCTAIVLGYYYRNNSKVLVGIMAGFILLLILAANLATSL